MQTEEVGLQTVHKIFRGLLAAAFVLYFLINIIYNYSTLNKRLMQGGSLGIKSYLSYKAGQYTRASDLLRQNSHLTYDPELVNALIENTQKDLEEKPDDFDRYYDLADIYFYLGRYDYAEQVYRQLLDRKMNRYSAKVGLVAALLMQDKYEGAEEALRVLHEQRHSPEYFTALLQFLPALERLEDRGPADQEKKHVMLSQAYRYWSNLDYSKIQTSLRHAKKALSINKQSAEALVAKADALAFKEDYKTALEAMEAALALEPDNPYVHLRAGRFYRNTAQADKVLSNYKRAVELAPEGLLYVKAFADLNATVLMNNKQALVYYRKYYELSGNNHDAMHNYLDAALNADLYDQVLAEAEVDLKLNPGLSCAYEYKASALKGLRRFEEALEWYLKANDIETLGQSGQYNIALCYIYLGQSETAIPYMEASYEMDTSQTDIAYSLLNQYYMLGRFDDAYLVGQQILQQDPDHSGARTLMPYLEMNRSGGRTR